MLVRKVRILLFQARMQRRGPENMLEPACGVIHRSLWRHSACNIGSGEHVFFNR